MKRKIIALLSSLILCIPFVSPVYADTVTYWDGSIIGADPAANALFNYESQSGYRWRHTYKPTATMLCYRPSNGTLTYGAAFYIGEYETQAGGTLDANYFKSQNITYKDYVASNSLTYATTVYNDNGSVFNYKVGNFYRYFLVFAETYNVGGNSSTKIGNSNGFFDTTLSNSTNASTIAWHCIKQILGYESNGSNSCTRNYVKVNDRTYINSSDDVGFIRDGIIDAFDDGNIIEPTGGTGSGSADNESDGYGNGIPSGSGTVGSSTINFDGSDNQVQNQSQYQTQSIESNAVNVTVNNEITGGGGSSGSTESDVDRINALDNLLANQNVGTSFNSAIQNINNFRQLGVAFADTTTVFLGWLPSWVTALLGLMFTLLFFFIILRLLKVFHG